MTSAPLSKTELIELFEALPHFNKLAIKVESIGGGEAVLAMPYDAQLTGNPQTGHLHGGAVTTLLDSVCGAACFSSLTERKAVATLDLRIDYLKPAAVGEPVRGWAGVFKSTRNVIFINGLAYHENKGDPIAKCVGTFMVGSVGFNPGGGK